MLQLIAGVMFGVLLLAGGPAPARASEIPDEGARYDYRRWRCRVEGDGYRMHVSAKVTIFNERGLGYADLAFSEDRHKKLKSVSIRLLDADGQVLYERGKKDLTKACGFDRIALYDDACTYYGTFKSQRFPYSLEYEYEQEIESLFYLTGCSFQAWIPVIETSYELLLPENLNIRYKTYGLAAEVEPVVSLGGRSLFWQLDDLPARDDVDYLPPGYPEQARLAITPERFEFGKYEFHGGSWSAVGLSKLSLYYDRFLEGVETARVGAPGSETDARSIYGRVREDVRYVAIEVGMGGWRPYAAELTQERGFGDCKDMSTLLVSKLRLAGIEAHPVFVLTRSGGPLDLEFPQFRFNHVIAVAIVEGDTVWMDPTCDNCPYGELPTMDEDIDVVVGGPVGGVVRRTPASTADQNGWNRQTQIHVGADARVSFESELRTTGNYALWMRGNLPDLDADETRRFVDNRFPGAGKKFDIESYEIEHLDDLDQPVIIRIRATVKKPARKIGGILYCSPFLVNKLGSHELVDLDDRAYPLNLVYPDTESDIVTLTYDSSLAPDSVILPEPDSLAFPFGEVVMRATAVDNGVEVSLRKSYFAYLVMPDQFEEFVTFRKRVKKICNRHVKLVSSSN